MKRAAAAAALAAATLLALGRPGAALLLAGAATQDFDHLRRSVVRIQSVSSAFDWLHPFEVGQDGVGLGSGFVVQTEPYPLFVTNEHVINDAKQVALQLLLYGEQQWAAEVVSVCPKFDLALLVLREPAAFSQAMAKQNITLQALGLADGVAAMGADVVALGFPLGQDTLKISKGNIAGNEEVSGNICIQSTAPISPGSSGGPLLDAGAREVVGVNFAKATEGENINYVIPAWRVQQMVGKHLKDQPGVPQDGEWKRLQVQVPTPELTTVEANEALYALSDGCQQGVYITRVGKRSYLRKAHPAIPAEGPFFLTAVNGRPLDRFGMGLNAAYAADRVAFKDLFFMVPDLSADVEFETCHGGRTSKHRVSVAWAPEYERGIRYIDEPYMAGMASAYEMFGGVAVMEMTVNHISAVLSGTGDPGPARWLHPDFVAEPRLVISFVRSGSYAADVLTPGAAIAKVNGQEVRTLRDFRRCFIPDGGGKVWTLETDMGKVAALMFNESLTEQLALASALNAPYLLTPGVVGAAKKLGLASDKDGSLQAAAGGQPPLLNLPAVGAEGRRARRQHGALLARDRRTGAAAVPGLGGVGGQVRAAGPLLALRPAPGAALATRTDAVPRLPQRPGRL